MYPEKFDTSKLTDEEKQILANFFNRRKIFDEYLTKNNHKLFTCPSCGYPELSSRGNYEMCSICWWEDDNQDDETADEIWGGPNSSLSLTESRLEIGKKLKKLANELHGEINLDTCQVLQTTKKRNEKINEFDKKNIKSNTHRDDPIWKDYNQLREDTLGWLIKPN